MMPTSMRWGELLQGLGTVEKDHGWHSPGAGHKGKGLAQITLEVLNKGNFRTIHYNSKGCLNE